jgi:predicted transcriptional regulator
MGIHKGTKLTDTPKTNSLKFRYDEDLSRKLNYLAEKDNISKAEVIRKGIEIQYENKDK